MKKQCVAVLCWLLVSAPAVASEFASAEEARALLERAATEVQRDEAGALAKFNSGEEGFMDRDLYVFCFSVESGTLTAHPALLGADVAGIKDKNGYALGQEMFDTVQTGVIAEISYFWPRPGETEPVQKHSFYTRVGDQGCGVGYYE